MYFQSFFKPILFYFLFSLAYLPFQLGFFYVLHLIDPLEDFLLFAVYSALIAAGMQYAVLYHNLKDRYANTLSRT